MNKGFDIGKAETYCYAGCVYLKQLEYYKAIEVCKKALMIKPDYPEPHTVLGTAYLQLGLNNEAVNSLQESIKLGLHDAFTYNMLASAYASAGRYDDAISACEEALRAEPNLVGAHVGKANCYINMNKYREAVEAAKNALKIDPDSAIANYFLGAAYICMRRRGDALKQYEVTNGLDHNLAEDLLSEIHKLL